MWTARGPWRFGNRRALSARFDIHPIRPLLRPRLLPLPNLWQCPSSVAHTAVGLSDASPAPLPGLVQPRVPWLTPSCFAAIHSALFGWVIDILPQLESRAPR